MKIFYFLILIFAQVVASNSEANSGNTPYIPCDMPETALSTGQLYNNYVCEIGAYQENGQFEEAIKLAEIALDLNLYETPNIFLFPRLTILYTEAGNIEKANETLLKSKIALELYFGISTCDMDYVYHPGIDLGESYDQGEIGIYKGETRIDNSVSKGIYFRICQENSYFYTTQGHDLDTLLSSQLIDLYQQALEKVKFAK